jgi:LuxR family maltose regulon positive regulatory protein
MDIMPTSALPANTGGRPFPQKDNDADLSASPLLITKLHIPRLGADLIARPHLIQWIDERMRGRLVVVSAPAGSGKTTLLSAWAVQSPLAVAWLSLDEGDNDPVRFLNHLVATLRTVLPGLAKDRSAPFVLPQPGALYTAVSALINHLASAPQDVALILDDYHTIRADEIHGAIAFLIDHLPTQIHVLLAGRSDPPLRLARLRASGQLAELRTQDLRFTPEETALFLRQMVGSDMSPQDVSLLQARTEGWIAGLKLAALSLQGRDDVHNVVESFAGSHRYVVDYLIEEVLYPRPPERVAVQCGMRPIGEPGYAEPHRASQPLSGALG